MGKIDYPAWAAVKKESEVGAANCCKAVARMYVFLVESEAMRIDNDPRQIHDAVMLSVKRAYKE